ncbi:MAG: B12-binding domain-containing radical SAM protein [Eubacteriaceae bacterium]|nr:B12-binding domain-containing radical SAM protein [Eubacteriaceae bacterium]
MIKLLLIQPENAEIKRWRRRQFNNFSQITMPYLAAFVDSRYFEITIIDEYNQKIPYSNNFDLAAITVNTPNAPHSYQISEKLRKAGVKVVMGGPHVTLMPDEAMQHADFIVAGEGEEVWPVFLEEFRLGNPKQVYISESPPRLDSLPAPRWDLVKRAPMMKGAVFATRGCPYNCRYCNLKQIYHAGFRKRPVIEVVEELMMSKSRFFVFWDDNLFADGIYAKELMRALAPLKRKWAAQATLKDCNDDSLLELAKAAGCLYIFAGIESFQESSLKDAGKEINQVDVYSHIIDKIHSHGIMVQAGIVFGFDSDTEDIFDKTLYTCEKLGIDGATVSLLTPFPKTPIYEQYKKEGRLTKEDWSHYNGKTAVAFSPSNMDEAQLWEGYARFIKRFYSIGSFIRRMSVSRTNILVNLAINLGYKLGIRKNVD